jgi:hypothetical protein
MTEADPRVKEFVTKLENGAEHYAAMARIDFTVACLLFWIAVLTSIAAALGAYFSLSQKTISILAAAPALVMLIEQTFSFEARSNWHWERTHILKDVAGQVRFKNLSVEDAFDQKNKRLDELEKRFPKLRAPFLGTRQS